ncbi:MAG: excinuclease ABC subunit UvrC [Pseudanabaenaceae cyanobacterium SKYGB_i_bin29]|nr:excinuclease ABC subunit UvrC [Pseudanabaenaceae cyanobacterium SKYG29]MDW8421753.1 excinuclease ABC subunit UvrC [Pseudanabaenaceae cyanobacterium SKYGB_i_bin29]
MTPLVQNKDKLEERLKEIPPEPGVYFMRGKDDQVLYIGKSKNLRNRVRSYFRSSLELSPRIAMMVQLVWEIEFIVTDTEAEALALEDNLIKQYQPYYNVLLKDDKKYPYVCITWSEEYPRIFITRRKTGNPRDRYYGPYVDSFALKRTLSIVKRIFPLRQRPQPLFKDRPCLNYDIGLCPGVCQKLISPEEYRRTMHKVGMVFQGRIKELVDSLTERMEQHAENLEFEQAAKIRDQINTLKALHSDQKVTLPDDTISRDAIALAQDEHHTCIQLFQIRAGRLVGRLGFVADSQSADPAMILQRTLEAHYQNCEPQEIPTEIHTQLELPEGELLSAWLSERKQKKVYLFTPQRQQKAELIEMVERNAQYELARIQKQNDRNLASLEGLTEILGLEDIPRRIEGYDISHIQGTDVVASQVVFIDGLPAKQFYRHYKIRHPEVQAGHADDFASMAEVISRRFHPSKPQDDYPELVMIDGGKGQLSAVMSVLRKYGLAEAFTVIGLAKKREEIFLPGKSEPLVIDREHPGLQLLRRVRDEAHRFAVSFHRQKRSQRMQQSILDQIPGLGRQRQKLLLEKFHSVEYLRQASLEHIATTPGIGEKLAYKVYSFFHPDYGV